jgi:valyl-tRNA synthetase
MARGRNFATKIWNASRLLFTKADSGSREPSSTIDRWIGSRLSEAARLANRAFEQHRYNDAADAAWTFFWDEFCDWYLERKKQEPDWSYAFRVYDEALKLLHPVMPFITEELWHRRGYETSIALERYPDGEFAPRDTEVEDFVKLNQQIITATRAERADHKIDRKIRLEGVTLSSQPVDAMWIADSTNTFYLVDTRDEPGFSIQIKFPDDASASTEQRARLSKENEQLEKVIENYKRQLENEEIVCKMPERVVANMRSKLVEYEAQLAKNRATLIA